MDFFYWEQFIYNAIFTLKMQNCDAERGEGAGGERQWVATAV